MPVYTDDFNRADGALGSIPGGPAWEVISGTWAIASNRASSSTAASSNPVAVVDTETTDADLSVNVSNLGGDAIYGRVVDANNWFRAKVRRYQTSTPYYVTEYEWKAVPGGGTGASSESWCNAGYTSHTHEGDDVTGWGTFSSSPWGSSYSYSHSHSIWYKDDGVNCSGWNESHSHSGTPYKTDNTRTVIGGYTTTTYYQVILERCVAGTITNIGQTTATTTSTLHTLRLRMVGNDIRVYMNGGASAVITATDSSHSAATKFGIGKGASDLTGSALDNFSIDTLNSPPTAPSLIVPTNSQFVDLAAGYAFDWAFNDPDTGDSQSAYAFRRRVAGTGTYEYWNAATAGWGASEVKNASGTSEIVFAAGKWSNGVTYNWSVKTWDAADTEGVYASDFTVTGSSAPTATITYPTGTITDTSEPLITWSYSHPDSVSRAKYQVIIETGAFGSSPGSGTQVEDSTLRTSTSLQYQTQTILTNGETYRVFVQVTDINDVASNWAHETFAINLEPPAEPVLSLLPNVAQAYIDITVYWNGGGTDSVFDLYRSDDQGTTWQLVRGGFQVSILPDDPVTVRDREAPLNVPVQYRAFTKIWVV